jgi:hypothetical protein
MNSVLFLVSKSAQTWPDYKFVLHPGQNNGQKTVILLENADIKEGFSADQVYQLNEGHSAKMAESVGDVQTTFSSISYRDLLDLIFSSDHSVVV